MKILCVLGKHQYGTPSLGIGIEYSSFIPALKNLGHDVHHFESRDRSVYTDFAEQNKALLEIIREKSPDVMLAVQRNYEIWIETLQAIQNNSNTATVCWTTDDNWKYREVSRFIGRFYDVMTTTYPEVLPEYHNDGISNVLLTQWAANSEAIRSPVPAEKCRYQVSFVGSAHGDRKKRIHELRQRGIDVTCFGNGWPNGPVDVSMIPEIMQNSVISLNFGNSKKQGQIKARNFEVPGAGGFLLSETVPELELYYSIGKEIDVYRNTDDLVQKIHHYLSHPKERDAMALAGNQRTRQDHTYEMRLKEVLDYTINAKGNRQPSKQNKTFEFEKAVQAYRDTYYLRMLRNVLVIPATMIWGTYRGPRAARRLVFELSWRFCGKKTFSAAGLPGRMFPEQ